MQQGGKGPFWRLARPPNRHYTFARSRRCPPAANQVQHSTKVLICRLFCSLRLSVRTPPFHGGESGSIPLGSANLFNGLALLPAALSNEWTINRRAQGQAHDYYPHHDRRDLGR